MADSRLAGSLWTPEEDVALLKHVAKYGTKHWGYLQTSGLLPHRDQKACCNRFILLKRKFFQARAKGQRLTFPLVPQPPDLRASSSGPLPGSPSSLVRPSSTTSLKRSAPASPSSAAVTIKRTSSSLQVSSIEHAIPGDEGPSPCGYQVEKPLAVQRTSADVNPLRVVPQVVPKQPSPAGSLSAHEAVVPSSMDAQSKRSSPTTLVTPKLESCPDVVCLGDKASSLLSMEEAYQVAPQRIARSFTATKTAPPSMPSLTPATPFPTDADHTYRQHADRQQLSSRASLDSMANGLPAANSIQSAMWRCFNPALVEAVHQEIEMSAADGLGLALDQDFGSCQGGGLAPDALLDQIASAPARMMFGSNNSSLPLNPRESSPLPQGGGLWQPTSAAVADLWDILRSERLQSDLIME